MSWNFHVRIIGEGHTGESITCERLIAHFVKGRSDWCLINAVTVDVDLSEGNFTGLGLSPPNPKVGLLSPSQISFFSAALTADRNIHECTVGNLASGDGGGCFQPVVHFLSAAQRFLHVFADVLGADEVRKFGLLDEL